MNAMTETYYLPQDTERTNPVTGQQLVDAVKAAIRVAHASACRQLGLEPGQEWGSVPKLTPDATFASVTVLGGDGETVTAAAPIQFDRVH